MVCIVCFDIFTIIKLLKCDRYSSGVIKLFNYSGMTHNLSYGLVIAEDKSRRYNDSSTIL